MTTARVTVLMPPAVDPGDPPISISRIRASRLEPAMEAISTVLKPAVRAVIPRALEVAANYLGNHGLELVERGSDDPPPGVITPGLDLDSYESGRPDDRQACRHGDRRVLNRAAGN